jgi:hypothetical protein
VFSSVKSVSFEPGHDSGRIRSSVCVERAGVELQFLCRIREAERPNHQGIKETLLVGCIYICARSAAIAAKLRR